MRWFSSDHHFGHANVIRYCNRPFSSVEEMNTQLVAMWNTQVKPGDEVFYLGDFSLNPKWSREIVPKLNGTLFLIHGNHDATFPHKHNRKQLKMMQRYLEDGWKGVYDTMPLVLKDDTHVLMSHMPYRPKDGDKINYDLRYLEHRPVDRGSILLHGHLHKHYLKNGRMIDVGIDGSFKLLSEDDVIAIINDERDFIPSEITEFYKTRGAQGGGDVGQDRTRS